MNQIVRAPGLWNANDLRSKFPGSPHKKVDDIWLRFNRIQGVSSVEAVANDHESVNYPAFFELSEARVLIFDLARLVNAERIGRVMVTRLAPGQCIDLHVDGGAHASYYERYHVVLQGLPGSMFHCGGETVQMRTGEVWWFQNQLEHSVVNNSADDRVHMVVDLRTPHREES